MSARKYEPGDRFGDWTMLARVPGKGTNRKWLMKCGCGKLAVLYASNVTTGKTKRCGTCRERVRRESRGK